jgi:hypothetical protein
MSDASELRIAIKVDPTQAVSGSQQASGAVQGFIGPLTEAQAAAQRFGTSVEVAEAALAKLKAGEKAAEVSALAAAMREAAAATDANAEATTTDAAASDAAAEQAEKLNAMLREHQQSLMRNAFYVHRLAEGFKDLSMGGRVASQGLMDIFEPLQYMLGPEMAIYAAMGQVVAMLALMVTMHRNRAGEASAAAEAEKKAAEDTKDAWSSSADALKQSLEDIKTSVTASFAAMGKDAAQFTEDLHISTDAANALQAARDGLDDAKFGSQEAMLNLQEQQALQGKSGEDAELVRNDFNQRRAKLTADHELEKAQREQAEKINTLQQLQAQKQALENQITAAQQESGKLYIDQLHGAAMTPGGNVPASDFQYAQDKIKELQQQAYNAANNIGDAEGNFTKPLTPDQWAELVSLTQSLPQLHAKEQDKGPQYAEQIDRVKKEIEAAKKKEAADLADAAQTNYQLAPGQTQAEVWAQSEQAIMAQAEQQIAELQAQLESMTKAQDFNAEVPAKLKENDSKVKELTAKVKEVEGKIEAAKVDIQTAGVGVTTATEKGQASTIEAASSSAALKTKIEADTKEKGVQAQIDRLQAKLDALPESDVAGRQNLQQQIETWNEAKINAKRDTELAGEASDPRARYATNNLADAEIDASQGKLVKDGEKGDAARVEQLKATIPAADKALAEAFKQIVEKDRGDIAKTLQDVTALLAKGNAALGATVSVLQAHGATLDQHTRAIKQLSHGGGYQ